MDQVKVGKFIQELRREKGLTQSELGGKLNVTNKAVSKWETGKSLPDISLLNELCHILDISVTESLSGERINRDDVLERSDEVINDVLKVRYKHKPIDIVSSILIIIAMVAFFIPTICGFDMTSGIITIAIGILLLMIGILIKIKIWETIHDKKIKYDGIGFSSALTLLFIALKLTGHIDWSWLVVISPILIMIALVILAFLVMFIAVSIKEKVDKKQRDGIEENSISNDI